MINKGSTITFLKKEKRSWKTISTFSSLSLGLSVGHELLARCKTHYLHYLLSYLELMPSRIFVSLNTILLSLFMLRFFNSVNPC